MDRLIAALAAMLLITWPMAIMIEQNAGNDPYVLVEDGPLVSAACFILDAFK